MPVALRNRNREVVARCVVGQQLVYLMRPHQPAPDPLLRAQSPQALPPQFDPAIIGFEEARQQVDKRRFASPVGPDQCHPGAGCEVEIDRLRHDQRTELLCKAPNRQGPTGAHFRCSARQRSRSRSAAGPRSNNPPSSSRTVAISRPPTTNSQKNGLIFAL